MVESEVRRNLTQRWTELSVAGARKAYGVRADWSRADAAVARAVGTNCLIALKLGLYTGVDFPCGPGDRAFSAQVGGASYRVLG